jgi:hypothetical protein
VGFSLKTSLPFTEDLPVPRKPRRQILFGAVLLAALVGTLWFIANRSAEEPGGSGGARSADPPEPRGPERGTKADRSKPTAGLPEAVERSKPESTDAVPDRPDPVKRSDNRATPPSKMDPLPDATISINTEPWSYVYLDGVLVRPTPLVGHAIPSGHHRLRLLNPAEGLEKEVDVDFEPGEVRRLYYRLEGP